MQYLLTLLSLCAVMLAAESCAMFRPPEYIPMNLDDAMVHLDTLLDDSTIIRIREIPTEDEFAANAHFGMGLWMRNEWGLWRGSRLAKYFNSLGVGHPDYMSGIILVAYWRHLHQQPLNLNEQITKLKEEVKRHEEYLKRRDMEEEKRKKERGE